MTPLSMPEAFAAYEAARDRLPKASLGKPPPQCIDTLADVAERFDVFLLDAFGVLNIGETPIKGAPERVRALKEAGKRVIVVSNAASVPRDALLEKYRRLGYDFVAEDIVTSRMAAISKMADAPADLLWGVMGLSGESMADFGPLNWQLLGNDPETYRMVGGFLLVGSGEWSAQKQELLEQTLTENLRPVRIANPDIIAPRESGFSTEPGYFAHQLAQRTSVAPMFFGKPFPAIYDLAFDVLGHVDRSRVVMVGDSLHTDILGAQTAGIASVLISEFGFFAKQDVNNAINVSGIVPDFIAKRP